MTIRIITVGSKSDPEISTLIASYTRRIPSNICFEWYYIKNGVSDVKTSVQQESENILKAIQKNNIVILLDQTGEQISSSELSSKLFYASKDVTLIIGGPHGVSQSVKTVSDFTWALSKLVFPHQLVRLILVEQIYRAYTISINHPYHHK